MSETKFDCYSLDEEAFTTGEKGDALDDLYGRDELQVGREYFLGASIKPKASTYFNFDRLIEDMQEAAYDDGGEHAEDYLADLPDEKGAELAAMIEKWLDENVAPRFYKVTQVQRFTVTQADIDELRANPEAA